MNSLTEENYLKAIFHLLDSENQVTVNELSKFLQIKMPSVNSMMKKFADKNWVIYETYKPIKVTELGRKEAAIVVRKHRLTEMFLVEKMGFGWENVHEIAEQLEHVHSEDFFDKMDEILNFPKVDPHGEPIPDKDGIIITQNLKKLRVSSKLSQEKFAEFISLSEASVIIVSEKFVKEENYKPTLIVVEDAYLAFQVLMNLYQQMREEKKSGIERFALQPTITDTTSCPFFSSKVFRLNA